MHSMKTKLHTLLTALALPLLAAGTHAQKLSIQEVPLTANHVLYDGINGKVYASIPGTAALNPNTVAQINAATGAVEAYIPVAGGPDVLALSSDGSYLYVGTDDVSSVSRLNLSTSTVDQQFSLGTTSFGSQYPFHAGNIVPLTGMPQSVAVTRDYFGLSPANDSVVVYDNGVQRPTIVNRGFSTYAALTGSNSPNRIYSYDNETTAFGFFQLNLNSSGITTGQSSDSFGTGILEGFNITIKFNPANGLIYATNGTVVDPVALTDVGTFPGLGSGSGAGTSAADVVPNSAENRVYFLSTPQVYTAGTATLQSDNLTTFQPVSSFATSGTYSSIGDLYEISPSKFVFHSTTGVEFASPETLASIAVTAAAPTVAAGKIDQFTATGTYPDGSTSNITSSVTWSSSNTNVATISSTGLATGISSGTANITASFNGITSTPVPLTVTPALYHVLWNNAGGTASIWNYDADNGTFTQNTFGPYPGWTAKTIAENGIDGLTRLLWDNVNGQASLWSLDNLAGTFSQFTYGPYSNWTANALSVNPDGTNRLLWDNSSGRASIWTQEGDFGSFTPSTFGSFPGWTAQAIATDPSGNTQLLWDNLDGRMTVSYAGPYNLPNPLNQITFGPYPGWTASAISIGTDSTAHILWDNTNGTMSLWNYNTSSSTFTQNTYGPYPGWTAKAIADGSDGKTVVLWDNTDGHASIWSLNNTTGSFTQYTFGPYPGWTATAVSGGN